MKSAPDAFVVAGSLGVWRLKYKEGPKFAYVIHHGKTTQFASSAKEALLIIKWPKSTPTGQALREWFEQFAEQDAKDLGVNEMPSDEEVLIRSKPEIRRGESPHQDAIAEIAFESHQESSPVKADATLEKKGDNPEVLPFEVTAEDLISEAVREYEADPVAGTRMVV